MKELYSQIATAIGKDGIKYMATARPSMTDQEIMEESERFYGQEMVALVDRRDC